MSGSCGDVRSFRDRFEQMCWEEIDLLRNVLRTVLEQKFQKVWRDRTHLREWYEPAK